MYEPSQHQPLFSSLTAAGCPWRKTFTHLGAWEQANHGLPSDKSSAAQCNRVRISQHRESFNCFAFSQGDVGRPGFIIRFGAIRRPSETKQHRHSNGDVWSGPGRSLSTFAYLQTVCLCSASIRCMEIERLIDCLCLSRRCSSRGACAERGQRWHSESAKAAAPRGICKAGNHKGHVIWWPKKLCQKRK